MEDDPDEAKRRVAAWYALRDAKAAMQTLMEDATRASNSSLMAKLAKWATIVIEAEMHVSNLIAELDSSKWFAIQPIAVKLRQLGQRKADDIAGQLEAAVRALMEG